MSPYLDWALGKDPNAKDMPLWVVPNKKVRVADVEACMRDHYEMCIRDSSHREELNS